MNNNINFCDILKGHEGETFYSPIVGNIIFDNISYDDFIYPLHFITSVNNIITFTSNGRYRSGFKNSEIMIFPSKNQRNWNKWIEEQKLEVSKTWNKLSNKDTSRINGIIQCVEYGVDNVLNVIEKSAFALLKIYKLIDIAYGGNITNEEWNNQNTKYLICPSHNGKNYNFIIINTTFFTDKNHIAFHTEKQAKEFLSYSENVQLLKDYFML